MDDFFTVYGKFLQKLTISSEKMFFSVRLKGLRAKREKPVVSTKPAKAWRI